MVWAPVTVVVLSTCVTLKLGTRSKWSDVDEVQASQEALARLTSGLLHRCKEHIYICLSELGESGFEQRGDLLRAFQKVLTEQGE